MKTTFTLIIGFMLISGLTFAKGRLTINEYVICTFNKEVTSTEINQLENTGLNVIKVSENNQKVVYIESCKRIALSPVLQSKISSLTLINKDGQEIPLRHADNTSSTAPNFFSMFFNFLY